MLQAFALASECFVLKFNRIKFDEVAALAMRLEIHNASSQLKECWTPRDSRALRKELRFMPAQDNRLPASRACRLQ